MNRKRLMVLEKTCERMPSQWEGKTEAGEKFYARYRHGWLSAEINDVQVYEAKLNLADTGELSTEEMLAITGYYLAGVAMGRIEEIKKRAAVTENLNDDRADVNFLLSRLEIAEKALNSARGEIGLIAIHDNSSGERKAKGMEVLDEALQQIRS